MRDLLGKPMLQWQIDSLIDVCDNLVIATTTKEQDSQIADLARKKGIACVRGSEHDVLSRFKLAIDSYPALNYVRVTADCPLVSPKIIRELITLHESTNSDYTSNTLKRSFPDGLDAEVFSKYAFYRLCGLELSASQREHVTPGFYENPDKFKLGSLIESRNLGEMRWTIDYESDFVWLETILRAMNAAEIPGYEETLEFIERHPWFMRTQQDLENV